LLGESLNTVKKAALRKRGPTFLPSRGKGKRKICRRSLRQIESLLTQKLGGTKPFLEFRGASFKEGAGVGRKEAPIERRNKKGGVLSPAKRKKKAELIHY